MPTPIPGTMMTTSELFALRPQYTTRATDTTCYKPILESDSAAEGEEVDQEKHGDTVAFPDVRRPKECACFCGQHSKHKNYQRSKSVDPDFKYLQQNQCNECARKAEETAVRLKLNHKQGDDNDFQKTVTCYVTDETDSDSSCRKTVTFAACANEDENDENEMCPGKEVEPTKQCDESEFPLVDKVKDVQTTSYRRRRKRRCMNWKCAAVSLCLAVSLSIAVTLLVIFMIKSTGDTKSSTPSAVRDTKGETSGNTTTVSSIPMKNCESLAMSLDYTQFQKDPDNNHHQYTVPWYYATKREPSIYSYSKEKRSVTVTKSGWYTVSVSIHLDSFAWLSIEDKNKVFNVQMCVIISDLDKEAECTKRTLTARLILEADIRKIVQLTQNQSVTVELTADDKRIVHQDEKVSKFTITSNDCK